MSTAEMAAYEQGTLTIGMSTMTQFVHLMEGWVAHVNQTLDTHRAFIPTNKGLQHARLIASGVLMTGLANDGSIDAGVFTEVDKCSTLLLIHLFTR